MATGVTPSEELNAARVKNVEASTELIKWKLTKLKLEYVKITDIQKIVEHQFNILRSALLSLPSRAAPELMLIDDVHQMADKLREHVSKALADLSEEGVMDKADKHSLPHFTQEQEQEQEQEPIVQVSNDRRRLNKTPAKTKSN